MSQKHNLSAQCHVDVFKPANIIFNKDLTEQQPSSFVCLL